MNPLKIPLKTKTIFKTFKTNIVFKNKDTVPHQRYPKIQTRVRATLTLAGLVNECVYVGDRSGILPCVLKNLLKASLVL